jgi:hypothetical protein
VLSSTLKEDNMKTKNQSRVSILGLSQDEAVHVAAMLQKHSVSFNLLKRAPKLEIDHPEAEEVELFEKEYMLISDRADQLCDYIENATATDEAYKLKDVFADVKSLKKRFARIDYLSLKLKLAIEKLESAAIKMGDAEQKEKSDEKFERVAKLRKTMAQVEAL